MFDRYDDDDDYEGSRHHQHGHIKNVVIWLIKSSYYNKNKDLRGRFNIHDNKPGEHMCVCLEASK